MQEVIETSEDDNLRMARKIVANSFFPIYIPNIFYWNNIADAEKITQEGRKALKEIMDIIKI